MQPHSLFISDLHLSPQRQDLCDAFQRYCDRAVGAENLYILGDLSDAWVGDDDDAETALLIKSTLRKLVDAGTNVQLMTGNRDFLMGQQLADECGLTLLKDPSLVEIYGRKLLLLHGDSLCVDDAEYMAFRAQIQNPDAQALLMTQSLEDRRNLAAQLRQQSQSANATKTEDIMDVNQVEVSRQLQAHNVSLMIHGHTHRPNIHELGDGSKRYVLGDWDTLGWHIIANEENMRLESFNLSDFSPTP